MSFCPASAVLRPTRSWRSREALYLRMPTLSTAPSGSARRWWLCPTIVERAEMHKTVPPIAALVLVLGLGGPIAVGAEITSVPSTAPESSAASPPPPTILRGSRPAPSQPAAVCPPGYTLSPGYGCIGASGGDYADGSPPGPDTWVVSATGSRSLRGFTLARRWGVEPTIDEEDTLSVCAVPGGVNSEPGNALPNKVKNDI